MQEALQSPIIRQAETWAVSAETLDLEPVLSISNQSDAVQITIGIPAYKREEKLIRCLESIARQNSRPFSVIISNDDPKSDISNILQSQFSGCFAALEVYQQPENLGSLANFNFLLRKANTDYFMWLANDDEISETWVEDLALLLDGDSTAAGAMGDWVVGSSKKQMIVRRQIRHNRENRLLRILGFIWRSDDAFFYGLFRREALLQGGFSGYSWPNNGYIRNWCYVFLIGPLAFGRMIYTDSCRWYNHDYGEKHYPASPNTTSKISHLFSVALRRVNVHLLYSTEVLRFSLPISFLSGFVSIIALLRDTFQFTVRVVIRRLRK